MSTKSDLADTTSEAMLPGKLKRISEKIYATFNNIFIIDKKEGNNLLKHFF